jgi:hypothetical protein
MKTRSNRWCNRTAVCRPRRSGPWGRSDAILDTIHTFFSFCTGCYFLKL